MFFYYHKNKILHKVKHNMNFWLPHPRGNRAHSRPEPTFPAPSLLQCRRPLIIKRGIWSSHQAVSNG